LAIRRPRRRVVRNGLVFSLWKGTATARRTLGRQGLGTSAVGYGAMGISMAYGPGDDAEGVAEIHRAYELDGASPRNVDTGFMRQRSGYLWFSRS
jgi:hypothetical protein